jgi:hypothetical protein
MPNLPRRLSDAVDNLAGREASLGRRPVPARIERAVHQGVAIEHGRAIVAAARVRSVEYVANEAMHAIGRMARDEAMYARHTPHAAARLQAIAELAAMNIADIVAETGRD